MENVEMDHLNCIKCHYIDIMFSDNLTIRKPKIEIGFHNKVIKEESCDIVHDKIKLNNLNEELNKHLEMYKSISMDQNHLLIVTDTKFYIYDLNNMELITIRERSFGGISSSALDFEESRIALVGSGEKPTFTKEKVIVWDYLRKSWLVTLESTEPVVSVVFAHKRILLITENYIHVYGSSYDLIEMIKTYPNPTGIVAINLNERIKLALPSPTIGSIDIKSFNPDKYCHVACHNNKISCVCFNSTGSLFATTSKKGTIVRVFNALTSKKIRQYRRGLEIVDVLKMAFSYDSKWLCLYSSKKTIHVFRIFSDQLVVDNSDNYQKASFFGNFMPSYMTEEAAHAHYYVKDDIEICCFDPHDNNCLITVDMKGNCNRYKINPEKGNLLTLESQTEINLMS